MRAVPAYPSAEYEQWRQQASPAWFRDALSSVSNASLARQLLEGASNDASFDELYNKYMASDPRMIAVKIVLEQLKEEVLDRPDPRPALGWKGLEDAIKLDPGLRDIYIKKRYSR